MGKFHGASIRIRRERHSEGEELGHTLVENPTMTNPSNPPASTASPKDRQKWEAPALTKLPALTELTLQTGGGIPGGGGGGGTVF